MTKIVIYKQAASFNRYTQGFVVDKKFGELKPEKWYKVTIEEVGE